MRYSQFDIAMKSTPQPEKDVGALALFAEEAKTAEVLKPRLTIAACVARSSDPYQAAIQAFTFRDIDNDNHTKTFHFEDGSELVFEVTYTARRVAQESK